MISVIVPVYNVEKYLRRCLDSIMNQTFRELEILVIDDGSTDASGEICDEYAEQDKRIRVFHTENRGLSAARNLGLDEASGEWIGFVDSDDWIEVDMYEVLLNKALETDAEIVECGVFKERDGVVKEHGREDMLLSGMDAVKELLCGHLSDYAWDKLWNSRCFEKLRFPVNRVHEDTAITYQCLANADKVCVLSQSKYHYVYRPNSLSTTYNIENLIGFWLSVKEQYDFLWDKVDDVTRNNLLKFCAIAVSRTWTYYYDANAEKRKEHQDTIREMNHFTKRFLPFFGFNNWKKYLRVGVFFPHFLNPISFRIAWIINHLVKKI